MRIPRLLTRHSKQWTLRLSFRIFFIGVLLTLLLVPVLCYYYLLSSSSSSFSFVRGGTTSSPPPSYNSARRRSRFALTPWKDTPVASISSLSAFNRGGALSMGVPKGSYGHPQDDRCSLFNCFDVHRCGKNGHHRLSIYLYPIRRWVVDGHYLPQPSKAFLQLTDALRRSKYWVEEPEDACLFFPTLDTLYLQKHSNLSHIQAVLTSLPYWGNNGQNHILVSFNSSALLSLNTEAILALSGLPFHNYRPGFHIPILVPNFPTAISQNSTVGKSYHIDQAKFLSREETIIAISVGLLPASIKGLLQLGFCRSRVPKYSQRCVGKRVFEYPSILKLVDFCILWRDVSDTTLWDVMSVGCIPVILVDFQRLPFDDVLDWSKMSIVLRESDISEVPSILSKISKSRKHKMKLQVDLVFKKYFQSMYHVANTIMEVLQDRVFPFHARATQSWNYNSLTDEKEQPLFSPGDVLGENGFTAVILAYDRLESLFQVINNLVNVTSLAKIVVVWNNQKLSPPPRSMWPSYDNIEIRVIKMDGNRLSNRFFPFEEIETEAIFSLDDDITMLTPDEVEFGFQAWREFPERLVGFPSRNHVWDNTSLQWKYESEWTNEISMVLTGASFYHKYWHHAFTHDMPAEIRKIVDSKMNCEDIAMNFLIAATIRQPPIKVTPRKKFKCPTCSNNEMLSSDSSHMLQRTECINLFAQIYGFMPLLSAEFRVDPVLYKADNLPLRLQKYKKVGSL